MAVDKLVDSTQLDACLTSVANAIRTKGGTSASLAFPNGFVSAIEAISGGAGVGGGYPLDSVLLHEYADNLAVETQADYLYPFAFKNTGLTSFSAPNLIRFTDSGSSSSGGIGQGVFQNCTRLTSVSLPALIGSGSGGYQFSGCTALTDVYMPNCPTGQYMFRGCTALKRIAIPNKYQAGAMNNNGFYGCTNLEIVDLGAITKTGIQEFYGCTKLTTLILRKTDSITALTNINCFTNTPFASGKAGGTLYVPSALISAYQSATNWSTILGYTNNNIEAIEGSPYENVYADGRPVNPESS